VSGDGNATNVPVGLTGKVSNALTISPATVTFPNTATGATSTATTLTVTNNSLGTALITAIAFPAQFNPATITTGGCAVGTTSLAPGGTCLLAVTFLGENAVTGNAKTGTLSATATVTVGSTANTGLLSNTVALTGTTVTPAQLVSVGFSAPQSIQLGGVRADGTSQSGSVTLTYQNTGAAPTGQIHYTWSGLAKDTPNSDFLIQSEATGGCVGLTSLLANATCAVTIYFKPSSGDTLGTALNGVFTLSADQSDNTLVEPITLYGTPVSPTAAAYVVSAGSTNGFWSFPMTATAGASTAEVFTITNPSTVAVTLPTVPTTPGTFGSTSGDIATYDWTMVSAGANPCGATVAAGASCTFGVKFTPVSTSGYSSATLAFTPAGGSAIPLLGVFGQVQTPAALQLTLAAAPAAFSQAVIGSTTTATQSFTVLNTGETASAALTIAITTSGSANTTFNSFVVGGNCSNVTLAAGANCVGTIAVLPTALGALTGNIQVIAGSINSGTALGLTATGVIAPTLTVSPSSVTFPSLAVGGTTTQTITVSNLSGAETSNVLTITLGDKTNYSIVSDTSSGTCAALAAASTPVGLAPGTSCKVAVEFNPQTLGTGTFGTNLTISGITLPVTITGTAISALSIAGTSGATSPSAGVWVVPTTGVFTVTKAAGPTTALLTTAITGGNYIITKNKCVGVALSGSDTCEIDVLFTGTAGASGTLSVSDGTPGNAITVTLDSVSP
jgi:hypothetical protein